MRFPVLVGLTCFLLGACTGQGSGGSSSGGDGAKAAAFYRDLHHAQCGLEERCVSDRGRKFSSLAACEASLDEADRTSRILHGMGVVDIFAASHRVRDEALAKDCLNTLASQSCLEGSRRTGACDGAIQVLEPADVGAQCRTVPEGGAVVPCQELAAACLPKSGTGGCQVCVALLPDGAACSAAADCVNHFCQEDGRCGASLPKRRGLACTREDVCLGNLVCAGAGSNRQCTRRAALGAACALPGDVSGFLPVCMEDLLCVAGGNGAGVCVARLVDGATCTRDPKDVPCQHSCVFPDAAAPLGTCALLEHMHAPGEPCAALQGLGASFCDDPVHNFANRELVLSNGMPPQVLGWAHTSPAGWLHR